MRHRDHYELDQNRRIWPPEPGFFQIRYVRGGYGVPAQIVRDEVGWWQAIIDGVARQSHPDPTIAQDVARIWHAGIRCPEPDYRHMLDVRAWAEQHCPQHPCLRPHKPIDYSRIPPLMPPIAAGTDARAPHAASAEPRG